MDQVTPKHGYRPGLDREELLDELKELLKQERAVERLICRYLADLADAVEQDAGLLGAHADIYHLAKSELGLKLRQTRERIRIGRALRELPAIEQAFLDQQLSYSRTREVTRVAEPDDEQQWLTEAKELPMRALERRVAEAGGGQQGREESDGRRREDEPAQMHHLTPDVVELRVTLPAEAAALLERAMQGAKRSSERGMSDAEALEAVARDALANQDGGDGDPRRTVVLYECRHCERVELETGTAPAELPAAAAASLGCGAKVMDLQTAGRQVARGGAMPATVKNAVLARDRCRCRVPGCHLRRYVEVHHLVERSRGGEHSRRNCLTLCTRHHQWLHAGKLRIEGDADRELVVYDQDGERMRDRSAAIEGAATQGGSPNDNAPTPTQANLFATMGRRGGWHPDALCEATGLPVHEVQVALTQLVLAGRVAQDAAGRFSACLPAEPEDERAPPRVGSRRSASRVGSRRSGSRVGSIPKAAATQGGSRSPEPQERAPTSEDTLPPAQSKLLAAMGRRSGWHPDALCEATGLPVQQIHVALTHLVLAGRVTQGSGGDFMPCG